MNAVVEKPVPVRDAAASPTPAQPAKSRRRGLRLLGLLVVLLALGFGVLGYLAEGQWIETTDNAYVRGDIAVLGTRIEGQVLSVKVVDNQRVRAGDPLIELDPTDWRARLAQAQASATEATAAAVYARRLLDQQRSAIAAEQAAIAQAEAEQTRAGAEATRASALAAGGWASRQADELALATSRKAVAGLAAARARKEAAEQQIAVIDAQIAQADARVLAADAQVRLAENNLAYTIVRAPFDGVVGNRAAEPGQHVTPGSQVIALTPPADRLYVVANFKETQLRRMQPGMKVRLVPDIDPKAVLDGRVESLAPATGAMFSLLPPENATGNFTKVVQRVPVRIRIDTALNAPSEWLRAGLSVTAEVDTRGPDAQRVGLMSAAWAALRDLLP